MKILTINAGSSSIRVAALERSESGWSKLWQKRFEGNGAEASQQLFALLDAKELAGVSAVVHRIVHGGTEFSSPTKVTPEVLGRLEKISTLAPLHNPPAVELLKLCCKQFSEIEQIAIFDTAFFAELPEVARSYPLPNELVAKHQLRRYGFHGLAHSSMYQQWHDAAHVDSSSLVITFQLGSGCSVAVIKDGAPLDTSMGFTPLEGLMMATRAGDIDPGLLLWLQEQGYSVSELQKILNRDSGLLGVSGESSRIDELLSSNSPQAKLAVDLYCYRARKYLGSYLPVAGKPEAIIFGGGVGENSWKVRELIVGNMEWLGIVLDKAVNEGVKELPAKVSSKDSKIAVWVIGVDEEIVMAESM